MIMFKRMAVVLLVVLAALAAFIASRPSDFRISRSRTLSAPPDVVYAYVNDFRKWPEWSPWEKLDPAIKRDHSGAPAGLGASYHWAGNDNVGEGRMTITDSKPGQAITIRLEFMKPWTATNTAQFHFVPSGSGTNVTWTMTGRNNFVAKAFHLFMDVEKMVGPEFEKGLASLDSVTAAVAAKRAKTMPAAAPAAATAPPARRHGGDRA